MPKSLLLNREANDALEPLKAQLADLEQQIKDREGMVTALRAKTLENDLKIQVSRVAPVGRAAPVGGAPCEIIADIFFPLLFSTRYNQRLLSGPSA